MAQGVRSGVGFSLQVSQICGVYAIGVNARDGAIVRKRPVRVPVWRKGGGEVAMKASGLSGRRAQMGRIVGQRTYYDSCG